MTAVADRPTGGGPGTGGGCYVYGIVRGAVELPAGVSGIGGNLRVVRHGGLAAPVSSVDDGQPLGTRRAVGAHVAVLDALAAAGPVLPLRFGTIVPSEDELVEQLLAARHDEFATALAALDGHAQFRLDARYVEDAVLAEIVRQNSAIRRLRDRLNGHDEPALQPQRVQLGQAVARVLEHTRDLDIGLVLEELRRYASAVDAYAPDTPDGLVSASFLVRDGDRSAFEAATERLGERWHERARLRLIGPTAPYDFTDWALRQAGTAAHVRGG
jgi:hypothetical protein